MFRGHSVTLTNSDYNPIAIGEYVSLFCIHDWARGIIAFPFYRGEPTTIWASILCDVAITNIRTTSYRYMRRWDSSLNTDEQSVSEKFLCSWIRRLKKRTKKQQRQALPPPSVANGSAWKFRGKIDSFIMCYDYTSQSPLLTVTLFAPWPKLMWPAYLARYLRWWDRSFNTDVQSMSENLEAEVGIGKHRRHCQ